MRNSESDEQTTAQEEESPLVRWSRRKHEARDRDADTKEQANTTSNEPVKSALLTDADMPSIESLNEDSDYSGFLSPKVSETLRKQALHKLFHCPTFNVRDGLDDYDGIYTEFEKLGDVVTADMRHQMEMEAKKQLQQLAEQQSSENSEQIELANISSEKEMAGELQAPGISAEEHIEHSDTGDNEEVES